MIEAHEAAVDKALQYMEAHAMRVRRGHNGTQAERDAGLERGWHTAHSLKPEGVLMAKYRHRMSRAHGPAAAHPCGDPEHGQRSRWALDGA